jgi:hypothetical protein
LGGGGTTDGSVILAPAAAGRNRIVPTVAAAEGILIDAPSTQTADLLAIEGTGLSDTGRWAVDALGFSNQRVGAVVWRQAEPTHNFTFRGQPAAFDGARWVPADAEEPLGAALALVQEIIDANTLVLRAGGRITNLQTGAFAGGTITPGTAYYVSSTVAGQLTPVEPTTGRRDPVLTTISATAGVVTTGASRNLVEAPPPTAVGPTAPASPELGDLWYRTTAPIGLYVWRDDVSIGEWVPATLPEVHVGDAAPTAPQPGNLWFKTAEPVGLYIWYVDVDSSQWVSVGGGGSDSGSYLSTEGGTMTGPLVAAEVTTTAVDDGAKSSGTYTPSPVGGKMRRITYAGAFQIAAPTHAGDFTMLIAITNVAGAGAITASGFLLKGDTFTTTVGDNFILSLAKINGLVVGIVSALQ